MTRLVALDVGSSSVRAVAYDGDGNAEPGDARVTYGGDDADLLVDAARAVLGQVGEGDCLAISTFWHSLLPVDVENRPLGPLLTWLDLRGEPPALDPEAYHRRTGCFLHPSFWPAKIRRLAADGVRAARFLSFGDYLLLRLTGELRTSVSLASGTGLFDPSRLAWDEETLAAIGVDAAQLPALSDEPVAGVFPALGDGACANVGATVGRPVVTIGTSAAARVVAERGAEPRPGLFLYRLDERRVCEGGALSDGGNLHAWLRRTLRDFDDDALAARPAAAHGLVFEPFLGGERSPGWSLDRRGALRGLSFDTTADDLAQAALESVCYQLAEILDSLGGAGMVVATGAALLANTAWLQILADVLGRPVEVAPIAEASARGAALVVAERLGLPPFPMPPGRIVEPRLDRLEAHQAARERAVSGR